MKSTLRCRPGVSTPLALCLMLAGVVSPLAARNRATEQAMAKIDAVIAEGPYKAYWQSLEDYQVPTWYADAKFGIFIHWGVDAVPAFDDWYFGHMYEKASPVYQHHIDTYGPQSKFGYKDLIPMLTFSKFDPAQYAGLFKQAGAKFVVPVGEHHDGFPLYDCSYTMWNAARMGPKRDIVADLEAAVRKQGMHSGSRPTARRTGGCTTTGWNSTRMSATRTTQGSTAPPNPDDASRSGLPRRLAGPQLRDRGPLQARRGLVRLVDRGACIPAISAEVRRLLLQPRSRMEAGSGDQLQVPQSSRSAAAVLDLERGQFDAHSPHGLAERHLGQQELVVPRSDPQYRTPDSLVDDLVDIVSKNGVLLLNVGPMADGTIPEPEQAILRDIGKWLAVNGEAVYGTRPWKIFGEGPTQVVQGSFSDTKRESFTSRGHSVHDQGRNAVCHRSRLAGGPEAHHQGVASGTGIKSVALVGSAAPLKWVQDAKGLNIELPSQKPCDYAYALRIEFR